METPNNLGEYLLVVQKDMLAYIEVPTLIAKYGKSYDTFMREFRQLADAEGEKRTAEEIQ